MKYFYKTLLLLVLFLLLPFSVVAELSEDLAADFAVVDGVVVMPINDEYIVTITNRDNLHVGDILTVVKPGKKVFHPQTKEVIGTIDEVQGFLQVTRILSGYSYAKVLSEGFVPDNGAVLKRYEQVPAFLVDETQSGSDFVRQLKGELPQFRWLTEEDKNSALLTVTLTDNLLDFQDNRPVSLHKYRITEEQLLVSTASTTRAPSVAGVPEPKPGVLKKLANEVVGVFEQTTEERFAEMDEAILRQKQASNKGLWMGPNLEGHPTGLAVADFDGDGQQEIAVAFEKRIVIARVTNGQFDQLAEIEVPSILTSLSLDAHDLDGNGVSELYVSTLAGERPSSFVIEHDGDSFKRTIDSVRWLMRAVTFPGETQSTLLGQRLGDIDQVFSDEVFQVERQADDLVKGAAIVLPAKLHLYNFLPFLDEKKQLNYLYLSDGDYLKVLSAEGAELWSSGSYFGGSETCFYLKPKLRDEDDLPTCIRPRMIAMPGNIFLVGQNDGQRMVQRYRVFKRSRLVSLSWNGFALTENWRTLSQAGYLGDFAYADADNDGSPELVMAVKFQHKGLTNDPRTSIVINELN